MQHFIVTFITHNHDNTIFTNITYKYYNSKNVNQFSKDLQNNSMLKINRQTDYAVRVVLALAIDVTGQRVSSATIQEKMLIPQSYMPRIVAQLANSGIIRTFSGRDGGLQLAHPAEKVTLRDVVEAFEGPILISDCLKAKGEDDCPFQTNCQVRPKWGRVQLAMLKEMETITFYELAKEVLHDSFQNVILNVLA